MDCGGSCIKPCKAVAELSTCCVVRHAHIRETKRWPCAPFPSWLQFTHFQVGLWIKEILQNLIFLFADFYLTCYAWWIQYQEGDWLINDALVDVMLCSNFSADILFIFTFGAVSGISSSSCPSNITFLVWGSWYIFSPGPPLLYWRKTASIGLHGQQMCFLLLVYFVSKPLVDF